MTLACEDKNKQDKLCYVLGIRPLTSQGEWWLARAENPAPGMESELKSAKAKIQHLEHEHKEDRNMFDYKQHEDILKAEKYKKAIFMMAREIKNLCEGKDPELSNQKDKALEKAKKDLTVIKSETMVVLDKLERAQKYNQEVTKTMNILKMVVESVREGIKKKTH